MLYGDTVLCADKLNRLMAISESNENGQHVQEDSVRSTVAVI